MSCPTCDGRGEIVEAYDEPVPGHRLADTWALCPDCGPQGDVDWVICRNCQGSGWHGWPQHEDRRCVDCNGLGERITGVL